MQVALEARAAVDLPATQVSKVPRERLVSLKLLPGLEEPLLVVYPIVRYCPMPVEALIRCWMGAGVTGGSGATGNTGGSGECKSAVT